MSKKYPKGHSMNNPDIGTGSSPGLKGLPGVLPKPKPKKKKAKEQYAFSGKKIKMDSYYSGGGTVYTGR